MNQFLAPEQVESAAAGLLGGIDADDGPTDEQLVLLQSVIDHLWQRPDLDVSTLAPITPEATAASIVDPHARRRMVGLLMMLEVCRHPETQTQVALVEQYAAALDITGEPLDVIRTWITTGAEQANDDLQRFRHDQNDQEGEPALLDRPVGWTELDPALTVQVEALADLPLGTLGRTYIEFHRKYGFLLPGEEVMSVFSNAIFMAHDLNHVISGYPPTGPGEIALGAMEFAMNESEETWSRFLSSLSIHEAGMSRLDGFQPKQATMSRAGAADLVGEALERGSRCTKDFSRIDHLSMAEWPLDEVRAHFGVEPLAEGDWTKEFQG